MEIPYEQREGIDDKASICTLDGLSWHNLFYYTQKKFYCCNGDIQHQEIRTQLAETIRKIYNMSMFGQNKFFVRPRAGIPYTTTTL